MPSVQHVSLDNLEQLQEAWAASLVAQESSAPQPTLNSPRSLESCRRAGIDADLDLSKSTLSNVLIETLHKVSADGTAELPLQQRDVGATVTAERVKVLQLFPFSLRNVGTDDDKLRAYEKFQQREGRRVSTIRMLREIRQQLIAAEDFKLRKAHELAAAAASAQSNRTSSPPPKPKATPVKASASGAKQLASLRSPTHSSLRDSSIRDSLSPQDDRSDISLSTVSEATAKARLTKKSIRDHDIRTSPPRNRAAAGNGGPTQHIVAANDPTSVYARERKSFHARVSERSKSYGSEAHGAVSSAAARRNDATDFGSDSDDDGDVFVHHAHSDRADGVEFIHYVSAGPDVNEADRRTSAAFSAVDVAKRQQKRKETERLAAIERERKQRIIEDEERSFIRSKILKDRNAHRMIQTPAPPQWNTAVADNGTLLLTSAPRHSADEAPHPPLIDLAWSTGSIKVHRGFGDEGKEPSPSTTDTAARTPPINMEAVVSASLARAPSPAGAASAAPPVGPPQPPRSNPSSPLTTPRVGTPRDPILPIHHQRLGSGGSASDLIRNSPRAAPSTPPRESPLHVDPYELSAARRREVIEAATALRVQHGLWLAEEHSPLMSPMRGDATMHPGSSAGGEQTFDFSSREDRARAIESRRSTSGPHRTVTEVLLRSRDDDRDERWRAVERSRRAQDMMMSHRPTTVGDTARHGETMFL